MRTFNRLLLTLAIAFGVIDSGLAFWGQNDISTYFIGNAIVYLVIILLYMHINPKARGALNGVGIIVFFGFLVIVAIKVVEIIK